MKFPFLASIIIVAFFFNVSMRRVSRKEEAREMSFWEKERKSNNVRRKSLENLDYICIPVDVLPFGTSGSNKELENSEQNVLALKDEKIVNLTGITNTDLKLEYGTANITELSLYDQNYTALVRALQNWGKALYDAGRYEDSAKVLEFAVKKSDFIFRKNFILPFFFFDCCSFGRKSFAFFNQRVNNICLSTGFYFLTDYIRNLSARICHCCNNRFSAFWKLINYC